MSLLLSRAYTSTTHPTPTNPMSETTSAAQFNTSTKDSTVVAASTLSQGSTLVAVGEFVSEIFQLINDFAFADLIDGGNDEDLGSSLYAIEENKSFLGFIGAIGPKRLCEAKSRSKSRKSSHSSNKDLDRNDQRRTRGKAESSKKKKKKKKKDKNENKHKTRRAIAAKEPVQEKSERNERKSLNPTYHDVRDDVSYDATLNQDSDVEASEEDSLTKKHYSDELDEESSHEYGRVMGSEEDTWQKESIDKFHNPNGSPNHDDDESVGESSATEISFVDAGVGVHGESISRADKDEPSGHKHGVVQEESNEEFAYDPHLHSTSDTNVLTVSADERLEGGQTTEFTNSAREEGADDRTSETVEEDASSKTIEVLERLAMDEKAKNNRVTLLVTGDDSQREGVEEEDRSMHSYHVSTTSSATPSIRQFHSLNQTKPAVIAKYNKQWPPVQFPEGRFESFNAQMKTRLTQSTVHLGATVPKSSAVRKNRQKIARHWTMRIKQQARTKETGWQDFQEQNERYIVRDG